MAKSKTDSYVLTLKLKTNKSDISALDKYFELSRKLYNALLDEGLKRFRLMRESKLYQQARKETDKKIKSSLFKQAEEYAGYDKFALNKYSTSLRVNEFKDIDANTVQALSARVIKAIDRMRFGNAKKVQFIRYNEMYSIEGLTNRQGIRFRDGKIYFNNLVLECIVRKNDEYAQLALQDKIKYCRIIKKQKGNRNLYYVQLVLTGLPPKKREIGIGEVGIDIGTQTVAIVSDNETKLLELAEGIDNIQKEKTRLQRKLDRQRRSNNPNKYNSDGTINIHNRDRWIYSNNYIKTKNKLRDVQGKMARMSGLIIKNVIIDDKMKLDTIDRDKLLSEFDNFRELHDKEIIRIQNSNNKVISSMGI